MSLWKKILSITLLVLLGIYLILKANTVFALTLLFSIAAFNNPNNQPMAVDVILQVLLATYPYLILSLFFIASIVYFFRRQYTHSIILSLIPLVIIIGITLFNLQTNNDQKLGNQSVSNPSQRDELHIIDIQILQLALSSYYDEYKSYPPTLLVLSEKYKYLEPITTGSNTRTPPLYAGLSSGDKNVCSGFHLGVIFEDPKTFDRLSPPAHAVASEDICIGSNQDFNGAGKANVFDVTDSIPLIAK